MIVTSARREYRFGKLSSFVVLALVFMFGVTGAQVAAETVVNFATWASSSEIEIWRRDIAAFEKQNPDIKVNLITSSWSEYPDRLPLYLSGVIDVDVLRLGGQHLPTFAHMDVLLPLTSFVERGELDLAPYIPQVLGGSSYNGTLLGLPDHFSPWVLYYNIDLFEQYGLETPYELYHRGQWTWEAMERIVKQLTLDLTGDGNYDQWGIPLRFSPTDPYVRQSLMLMNGGPLYDPDFTRLHLDDPRNLQALEWLADLREYRGPSGAWEQGKVAMNVGYPTHQLSWRRTLKFNFGVAPLPRPEEGSYATIMTINIMSILKNANNPDAAMKFINYIVGEDIQRKRITDNYILSARVDVAMDTIRNQGLGAQNNEVLEEVTAFVRPWTVPPIYYEEVLAVLNGELARAASGQEAVASALARITPIVNAILSGGD